jgi:HlyD family secretion protein
MKRSTQRLAIGATVLVLAGSTFAVLRPRPLTVEAARAMRGPLQVTVDEEGETRVRDRYVVAAPVAGRVSRIELREGDRVAPGTIVARMSPTPLDARARDQAVARVAQAEDAQRAADAAVPLARAASDQARRTTQRAQALAAQGLLAPEARERAELDATTRARELESADFRARAAAHDVEVARAALVGGPGAAIALRAPVCGQVLRVPEPSERVVGAGAPLVELGDCAKLQVVTDLLSSDAVQVKPGDPMLIEGWGGTALRGRLRVVEPSGFTKVSALGVEEQRVNVIGDFVDPPGPLGDRYRVEVRIVVWESPSVLQVPASALVRAGDVWAVFVVERGRARRREVAVGHRTAFATEILRGLEAGDVVIRYPSDRVAEGVRVQASRSQP